MLSERGEKQGKKMTKASHCSSSSTLEVVVQRLAQLWFGVRLASLRACVKTNLPGVSHSVMEQNIMWPSIVRVNKQGFATDGLGFFSPPFVSLLTLPSLYLFIVNHLLAAKLPHCTTTLSRSACFQQVVRESLSCTLGHGIKRREGLCRLWQV